APRPPPPPLEIPCSTEAHATASPRSTTVVLLRLVYGDPREFATVVHRARRSRNTLCGSLSGTRTGRGRFCIQSVAQDVHNGTPNRSCVQQGSTIHLRQSTVGGARLLQSKRKLEYKQERKRMSSRQTAADCH